MPCDTTIRNLPAIQRAAAEQRIKESVARLERALLAGIVRVVIGPSGAPAFKGVWRPEGVSDLCAFRKLQSAGSAALRQAIARAEVTAGRKLNPAAVTAGTHSHDGGATWHPGH